MKINLLFTLFLLPTLLCGQNPFLDPDFNQNQIQVNPAFTGARGTINFVGITKVYFEGTSLLLSLDSKLPLFKDNRFLNPSIGFTHSSTFDHNAKQLNISLSNHFLFENQSELSIGAQYFDEDPKKGFKPMTPLGDWLYTYEPGLGFGPYKSVSGYRFGLRHSLFNNRLVYGLAGETNQFEGNDHGYGVLNLSLSGILSVKETVHWVPAIAINSDYHIIFNSKFYYKEYFYLGGFLSDNYESLTHELNTYTGVLMGGRITTGNYGSFEVGLSYGFDVENRYTRYNGNSTMESRINYGTIRVSYFLRDETRKEILDLY